MDDANTNLLTLATLRDDLVAKIKELNAIWHQHFATCKENLEVLEDYTRDKNFEPKEMELNHHWNLHVTMMDLLELDRTVFAAVSE